MHFFFFFNDTATTEIYTLSLHDALPISPRASQGGRASASPTHCGRSVEPEKGDAGWIEPSRSEEHTSELQSLAYLVCRLLLEKKQRYNSKLVYYARLPLRFTCMPDVCSP